MAEEIKTEIKEKEVVQPMDEVEVKDESTEEVKEEKKIEKRRTGILYINTTKNNTVLALTDAAGNTLAKASGGQSTKQSRLRSSPTVAMFSAKKIAEEAKEYGITDLYVRFRGATGGTSSSSATHAIVKSLSRDDFRVISVTDLTRMPRGGPKAAGGRRGRRV